MGNNNEDFKRAAEGLRSVGMLEFKDVVNPSEDVSQRLAHGKKLYDGVYSSRDMAGRAEFIRYIGRFDEQGIKLIERGISYVSDIAPLDLAG